MLLSCGDWRNQFRKKFCVSIGTPDRISCISSILSRHVCNSSIKRLAFITCMRVCIELELPSSVKPFWLVALLVKPPAIMWNKMLSHCGLVSHIFGSTLAQAMACCLPAPSHYMNQCWLIIKGNHGIHLRAISQEVLMNQIHNMCLEIIFF